MKYILITLILFIVSCGRFDSNLVKIEEDFFISNGNGRGKILVKKDFGRNNYTIIVNEEIVKYKNLSKYILIERHTSKINDDKLRFDEFYNSQKLSNDTIQFWIIEKENHNKLIGPLYRNNFYKFRDSLNIAW